MKKGSPQGIINTEKSADKRTKKSHLLKLLMNTLANTWAAHTWIEPRIVQKDFEN